MQYERVLPLPPEDAPLASLLVDRAIASVEAHFAVVAPRQQSPRRGTTAPSNFGATGTSQVPALGEVGTFFEGVKESLSSAMREGMGGAVETAHSSESGGGGDNSAPTDTAGVCSELATSFHW